MSDFRARDADRDRAVEVIETAYVDGQLGDADRELRVSRALAAETLGELEGLTRDLQVPARAAAPATTPAAGPSRPRRAAGVLVGLGVFVALVGAGVTGVVALFVFAVSGEPETGTSQGIEVAPAPIVSEEATRAAPFRMTAPQLRRFLTGYEKKFGTLDAFEVGFYPARVGAKVPVRGARPRFERWSFDGTWRQDTEAAGVTDGSVIIDVSALDVRRLFANIATARKTLRVQDGELTHVLLNTWSEGMPTVNIYIGNSFGEGGYLKTTMSGDVIRAFPHQP